MIPTASINPSIRVPIENNDLLKNVLTRVNEHEEIITLWRVINVNAIERLGMTDHGPVHFQIVANSALRLARLLHKRNIKMSLTNNYPLGYHHAEVVIFLASVLHDLGMSINRDGHEEFSLILSHHYLKELLNFLPVGEQVIVSSETLHAIISHRHDGKPTTIEAGIVRVADALDMSSGRSRIPFDAGKINIHSLSALAVENVEIKEGKEKPIEINILMNNSSGIYQIDQLLNDKLTGSGIESYLQIKAYIKRKTEKKLITEFFLNRS